MNIDGFMNVAKNYALNAQSDEMIVRKGQNGTSTAGRLGNKVTRFFRNLFGIGRGPNEAIRRDLAQAIASEYGGVHSIPKNVLQALKLDPNGKPPLDTEGNLKLGSTPLTARRIVAVMDAVNHNRRIVDASTKLIACFDKAARADEDFGRDYDNRNKTVKYHLNALARTLANKFADQKPEAFSEEKVRAFINDEIKGLGYRVHGDSASFGLTGAAPKQAVMDALIDDLIDVIVPPGVKRNREMP